MKSTLHVYVARFLSLAAAVTMLSIVIIGCAVKPEVQPRRFDVIIKGGIIYDGTGEAPYRADVGITGELVASVGDLSGTVSEVEIDAESLAVAPGFINMLSWATTSLIEDGKSQSDIRQGVTLEVFGEGWSMGPLNEKMVAEETETQGAVKYDITWRTLSGYLDYLVGKGVSCNVASLVGATTVRIYVLGYEDRPPTPEELEKMKALVRAEMETGALGLGSSLIYAPAFYADTHELIELAKVAAEYGGIYISHIRSEGNTLFESLEELISIAGEADIHAEIYHLKAAGNDNWQKLDSLITRVEKARAEGLNITADMYTYTAGATGLDAAMPPWVQEGGLSEWVKRLKDPETRARVIEEMRTPTDEWENLYLMAGSADRVILTGFRNDSLKILTGKTLAEVAEMKGVSPEEAAMDLVVEDNSRVDAVYFLMSEENVKKKIALPWVSFCSDAGSLAPEGVFLQFQPHPRAYGSFARVLGKYSRDEKVIPLEEAVRKLSGLPAENLNLDRRGLLREGYFADVVVFDPKTIRDHATYTDPHQYSTGMVHVFVNGVQVLSGGEHTGATPGVVVKGSGVRRTK